MKKVVFGIFAHPDDEAIGPSGTLMKWINQGVDVHLLCITDGQQGMNPDAVADLGVTRAQEWQAAGKAIGASSLHRFGYQDGSLNNSLYHEIAEKITAAIQQVIATYTEPISVSFVSFEENGLTGHLDHIAATRIASYIFYKLKASSPEVMDTFYYYYFPRERFPKPSTDFVYMNPGREVTATTYIENVGDWVEKKFAVMQLHVSQRSDVANAIAAGKEAHAKDYFYTQV